MEANLLLCSVAMVVAAIFINLNTTQLQESSSKRKKKTLRYWYMVDYFYECFDPE